MELPINIRNMGKHPVRITITVSSDGREHDEILITLGEKGKSLKGYYGVYCIDKDLEPNSEWENVGILNIESKYKLRIS